MSGRIRKFLFDITVSMFYMGYLPKGGGSVAALFGILIYLIIWKSFFIYLAGLILIVVFGIILGSFSEKRFNKKDPANFVIDDFAGMLVTLFFIPPKPLFIIIGFFLFRFFDIVKVYPIKKVEAFSGGQGIMLDDIFAGLYANLILQVLRNLAI